MKRPGHIPKACTVCSEQFLAHRPSQVACSRRCRDRAALGWRYRILERDSYTCGLCKPMFGREPKALRPTFLDVIRVVGNKKGTAGNLVTACRVCARRVVGRLPKLVEATVLAENLDLCAQWNIDPTEVLEP